MNSGTYSTIPRSSTTVQYYTTYSLQRISKTHNVTRTTSSASKVHVSLPSALGDRAFSVAAARAWNRLPPAVRDAPSLLTFRSRLKTWLFELTLAWHWPHSPAALHFVCDFSNSVKCPCNVTHDSVTLIFTFLIIIIIIVWLLVAFKISKLKLVALKCQVDMPMIQPVLVRLGWLEHVPGVSVHWPLPAGWAAAGMACPCVQPPPEL